jgi:hypothetical protein
MPRIDPNPRAKETGGKSRNVWTQGVLQRADT